MKYNWFDGWLFAMWFFSALCAIVYLLQHECSPSILIIIVLNFLLAGHSLYTAFFEGDGDGD